MFLLGHTALQTINLFGSAKRSLLNLGADAQNEFLNKSSNVSVVSAMQQNTFTQDVVFTA